MHDTGTSWLARLQMRTPNAPRRINLSIPRLFLGRHPDEAGNSSDLRHRLKVEAIGGGVFQRLKFEFPALFRCPGSKLTQMSKWRIGINDLA